MKKKHCWRYHHFTHVQQKQQSCEVQFLDTKLDRIFFVILGHFVIFFHLFALLPPTPLTQKTRNFEKMKEASGDVIILNLRNEKQNHDVCLSDIECDRHNFLSF